MPLRFLNYSSLQYQGRYRDHRWRKGDTADPVLHVVLYNGNTRWDAPRSLAELVPRWEDDGPAQLALSYDVVDLVAMPADDLPRPNRATIKMSTTGGAVAGAMSQAGVGWQARERRQREAPPWSR